ncbi:DNA repair exonuclease rad1 [Geopyxis carbonaria]|nr:DNA repair exonuclease rad1 [Geopyxis carbonaria]
MAPNDKRDAPEFNAITNSTRQLFFLLRCAGFAQRAQIRISKDGLHLTVEESRAMQAHVFIDKCLFNTFNFNVDDSREGVEKEEDPVFDISLLALLECLQIFGAEPSREKWGGGGTTTLNRSGPGVVFDQRILRITGSCQFSYDAKGHPLCLTLEENGVVTTCKLTTSEPEYLEDIPIAHDSLSLKIIMKANWLHDAVQELEGSSVERLIIMASPAHPYFSLSATGLMGSTVVEFSNDKSLLEMFQVVESTEHTYNFALVKHALKAMAISSKVSIRGDSHGVLSLQFMIEQDGGNPSFVDFRFVPYASDDSPDEQN